MENNVLQKILLGKNTVNILIPAKNFMTDNFLNKFSVPFYY